MPDKPQEAELQPPAGVEPAPSAADETSSSLPRPIQEHLGQHLRSTYDLIADKPAFLGDSPIPPQFDAQLQRLETRERVHHQGIEAVASALQDIGLEHTLERELASQPSPDRRDDTG